MISFSCFRKVEYRIPIVLFLLAFFNYIYFVHYRYDANITVRTALCLAVLTERTFVIDRYEELTIDKAFYDGHFYCDKAPGASLLGFPFVSAGYCYLLMTGNTDILSYRLGPYKEERMAHLNEPNRNFKFLGKVGSIPISIISAIGVAVMYLLGRILKAPPRVSLICALLLGFGTPYIVWATVFIGHSLAAALLLSGFALGVFLIKKETQGFDLRWCVAGFLLAYAVWTEYTAAVSSCLIGLYFLLSSYYRKKSFQCCLNMLLSLFLGIVPVALAFCFYNAACFGSPFRLGYGYETSSFEEMQTGFYGINLPNFKIFLITLVEQYHGIFWYVPLFALSPFLAIRNIFKGQNRGLNVLAILIPAYYFLLNASYAYWFESGIPVRHATAAFPFLLIPFLYNWKNDHFLFRYIVMAMVCWSLMRCLTAAMVPLDVTFYSERIPFFWHLERLFSHGCNLLVLAGSPRLPSYIPIVTLWALCGGFLWRNIRRIDDGESGPESSGSFFVPP